VTGLVGRVMAVAALAVVATGALAVPAAFADTAQPAVTRTNWWWSLTSPNVQGNTLPVGAPAAASTVPDGDLGVGYVADQAAPADKAAAVALDLSSIPLGSTFSSLRLSVPYDPNARQLASGTPDISACELLSGFQDGPGAADLADLPPYSLPSCVKGTYQPTVGAAGGYVFDLTAMGNDWSGGAPSEGVLLLPTQGLATPQEPFSLAFLGKNGVKAEATYAPAAPQAPVDQGPVLPPAPEPAAPPVADLTAPPPPPVAVLPADQGGVPVPAPQVAPTAPAAPALAVGYEPGSLRPGTTWWLGLLGLLSLLGATGLVLGDPMAPATVDSRRRRFAEVVRGGAHTPGTSGAIPTGAPPRPRPV
jgi:hypothetical protein